MELKIVFARIYLRVTAPFSLRSDIFLLSRAVAITLWPRFRASSAMPLPKPLDAALTKYTSGAMVMGADSAVGSDVVCAGAVREGESGLGWVLARFKYTFPGEYAGRNSKSSDHGALKDAKAELLPLV